MAYDIEEVRRTCYFCKHFDICTASQGYSEYTPGSEFEMYCLKDVWKFDSYESTLEDFRKCLESAKNCEFFECCQ